MSQAAHPVSATEVLNAVANLVDRSKHMTGNLNTVSNSVMTAAEYLALLGDNRKVAEYRDLVTSLGKLVHDVKANQEVLTRFSETYQPSLEETDFKAVLDQALEAELERKPYDARADPLVREFEDAVRGTNGEGDEGGPHQEEDLDDDEELRVEEQRGWINDSCPLSMKDVFELTKPVKDSLGYVYEYTNIMEYLRSGRGGGGSAGGCKHPVAGVQQLLRESDLQPAVEVEREKRRRRLQKALGNNEANQQANKKARTEEEVIDV